MELFSIRVADCRESETNPRGKDFAGKLFDELVASVKEKGVLMPVLARAYPLKDGNVQRYEVIAGNRRLRAAKEAGLKEIPAQVVVMSDDEAREAQIVENLQRADVHPLEEGEAYRQLLEYGDPKFTTEDIAARVGKPESYVKQRLYLTNLEEKPKAAYRSEKINDGHAVLIAKLSPLDQTAALKAATERYSTMSAKELKDWIEVHIYSPMDSQPWLNNPAYPTEELAKLVGKCVECKPDRAALFGDVKIGACTDLKCWRRKMAKYLDYRAKAEHLHKISTEYGEAPKGALGRDGYVIVAKKGKDRCESVHGAIAVNGSDIGTVFDICSDKDCATHHSDRSHYRVSPQEQAKRKKEKEREAAKQKKFENAVTDATLKVKWPLSEKQVDALLDLAFRHVGMSFQMPILKRHGLQADKKKTSYGTSRDYEAPLRRLVEGDNELKLRMVFELLMPTYNRYGGDGDAMKQIAKL